MNPAFSFALVYSGKENGLILFFSGTCICDLNCTARYWPGMHIPPFLPYRGRAVYRNIKRICSQKTDLFGLTNFHRSVFSLKVRFLVSFGFIGVSVRREQVFFAYSILFCLIVVYVRVITAAVSCN